MDKFKKLITLITIFTVLFTNSSGLLYAQGDTETGTPAPSSTPQGPVSSAVPATPKPATTPKPAATPAPAATPIPSIVSPTPTSTSENMSAQTAEIPLTNEENSGGQNDGGNTNVDSEINTGDATTTGAIANVGNTNTSGSGNGASVVAPTGPSVTNSNGSGTNNNSVNQSSSTTTNQNNSATIVNNLNQNSNTGENSNSSNTGGSSTINTGNANASGSIVNMVNTNASGVMVSEFNITDDHMGDYLLDFEANCISGCAPSNGSIGNSANGSNSQNIANLNSDIYDATFQNNSADIENNMTLTANTGNNTTSRNTNSDSSITTGDANIAANISNFANNNFDGNVFLGTVNIYGDLNGDIILPKDYKCTTCGENIAVSNIGNGDSSVNFTNADISDNYLLNQDNTANIENNVNINALTGGNDTSRNTGGDNSIETGDANILAQVVNIANNNIASGDWWLVVVNEAGNWIGKILGAPEGSNFASSEGAGISMNQNGEITVANNGNGEETQNSTSVNQSTTNETSQTNNANIVNNVNLDANTGGNSASRNTGGENLIATGDANVILNIVNFVNNNIVGDGRLFVTLVNVFGSWNGDFVAPGQTKEENNTDSGEGGVAETPKQPETHESGSSSNTSNTTSSNNEDNNSNENVPSVLGATASKVGNLIASTFTDIKEDTQSEETDQNDLVSTVNAAEDSASGQSININLAWALGLFPMYLIIRIIRKRFFM